MYFGGNTRLEITQGCAVQAYAERRHVDTSIARTITTNDVREVAEIVRRLHWLVEIKCGSNRLKGDTKRHSNLDYRETSLLIPQSPLDSCRSCLRDCYHRSDLDACIQLPDEEVQQSPHNRMPIHGTPTLASSNSRQGSMEPSRSY